MVLHTLEGNQAIARTNDLVVLYLEVRSYSQLLYLVLDQKFGGLLQALKDFAHANSSKTRYRKMLVKHQFSKEMALT